MQAFDGSSARLDPENGIRIGRWTQYDTGPLPFGAMWFEVAPGGTSALDQHPETELAVVVSGAAVFHAGDRAQPAPTGTAVLLPSGEAHRVVNASATEPVRVLSMYWLGDAGPAAAAGTPS